MQKKFIYTIMMAGGMLLASCSSDLTPDYETTGKPSVSGVATLRFSVRLENNDLLSTRLTNDGNGKISHIGKGEKIDQLKYAIYLYDEETGDCTPDESHPGQYLLDADFSDGKRMEFNVDLTVGENYRIAFWAQNSQSDAYDTSDLAAVEVKYKDSQGNNYANNDESRDAFCQIWTGGISEDTEDIQQNVDVTLKRPLAQINVGTTGADYKHILEGPNVVPHLKITHSQVSVAGVARFLSVVDDKVLLRDDMEKIGLQSDEAFTDVTFDWGMIPAFMNMASIPTTNEGLLESDDEEFLRVDLNRDGTILDYLTSYPTLASDKQTALTETFKYMSMCYVLAPSGESGSAVYGNIKVGFAEDENGKNAVETVDLASANGGRNYRTNILAGLAYVQDPSTPENPGDNNPPSTPENPGDNNPPSTPEDPGTDTPEDPGTNTPEDPGTDTPEDPGTDTPEDPGTDTPEDPGTDTPEDPGTDTPEDPGTDTPEEPGDDNLPEEPAPSLFTHSFNFLIQTDFQGGYTTDSWSENWITE